jgi:uncharacterized phiE125 gp8 family phage protein
LYSLKQITAPTAYPITVADVKSHAVISIAEDDNLIGNILIPAATEYAQAMQKRQLMLATWRLSIPCFPLGDEVIELPLPPLVSVTTIDYVDSTGVVTNVNATIYSANTDCEPGRITLAYGQSWPTARDGVGDVVRVTYIAGYGTTNVLAAAAIPANTKLGILMDCAERYRNRGDDPMGFVSENARRSIDALLMQDYCAPSECEEMEYA